MAEVTLIILPGNAPPLEVLTLEAFVIPMRGDLDCDPRRILQLNQRVLVLFDFTPKPNVAVALTQFIPLPNFTHLIAPN